MKAIEFDWILNSAFGNEFLQELSETDNIQIFSLDIIRYIILYQWRFIKKHIIIKLFIPFVFYFTVFILYSTWFIRYKNEQYEKDGENTWGEWRIICLCCVVFLGLFILYWIYVELFQIKFHRLAYFKSFWNLLDLGSIFINIAVLAMDQAEVSHFDINAVSSVAVIIMWFKMFYFLRIFKATAHLIRMIIEIIMDMKWFIIVLFLSIIGFANAFFILARNSPGDWFPGNTFMRSFLFSYRMGLGDFVTDLFAGHPDETLIWVLWFLNTLIILIILLNLVIAIMADTFDKVQETAENSMLQEYAAMIRENEFLFSRSKVFKKSKYIIVIKEETAEGGAGGSWEGKLN